ncbi:AAA family ATPase [Cellulomonas sp. URHB0016]
MQIRSLTLQAIGPFAASHTIDFDELGASGLFLLEGPTGSGKSTLIDAIVFALYGKVASSDASDDRLRSAFAPDHVESVVDLVFEVSSGLYRVRRTPAFQRAKKRGSGTTTAQATVKAWRLPADAAVHAGPAALDAVGVPLGNRLDEVGAELQRAVGLDRTQFVQTVVLPQGEFARFLRSDPDKERRVLLQKIFGTEVYERLQVRLAEMRAQSAQAVKDARGSLDEAVAHLVGAARLDVTEGDELRAAVDEASRQGRAAESLAADVAHAVGRHAERLAALATSGRTVAAAAEQARRTARTALETATATAALLERRDRLRAERAALVAQEDVQAEAVARLTAGRAARSVRPLLVASDAAEVAAAGARKALSAALDVAPADLVEPADRLVGAESGSGTAGSGSGTARSGDSPGSRGWWPDVAGLRVRLQDAHRQAVADAAVLVRVVEVEEGLEDRRRALRAGLDELDDLAAELAAHDVWLAGRPAEREALVARLDAARAAAARLGEHEAALRVAEDQLDAVRALGAAHKSLAVAERGRTDAARVAALAVEHERDLRQARIAGLAGELAASLTGGQACPVCGGVEHPDKAVLSADHVSGAQVEDAERARAAAESALSAARSQVDVLTERMAGLASQVAAATEESATLAVTSATGLLDECRAHVTAVARLAPELDGFDEATRSREHARALVEQDRASRAATLDAERALLSTAETEVIAARADHPTVAARHAALEERVEVTADLLTALADREAADEEAARRHDELVTGLAEAGFASADAARDALVPAEVLTDLDRLVTAYRSAADRTAAALAEPELAVLTEHATVDLDGARAAERDAAAVADGAARAASLAADRATAADRAGATVRSTAETLARRLRDAAPVTRMAGLAAGAGGDNGTGLSLATFVLMRRFEDVVAAANDRLLVMSDGRYELERSDEKEDVRSRNTGLAMRVLDHHTEQSRDPRTLSGGETFYVSLCLALGMADVVTAEAGGVDLGTLFVDEGFGSLDPHTLDQVLAELGRLRAGGRMVGVVSHVEALKQSIADRVEVRPTPQGPSTLVVRAG